MLSACRRYLPNSSVDVTDNYNGHDDLLDEVVYENVEKDLQIRLTVSEFRGNFYMGMRKWVIDIDDSWMPTKQGFTFPYNLSTSSALFGALTSILSKGEVLKEVLDKLDYKPDRK